MTFIYCSRNDYGNFWSEALNPESLKRLTKGTLWDDFCSPAAVSAAGGLYLFTMLDKSPRAFSKSLLPAGAAPGSGAFRAVEINFPPSSQPTGLGVTSGKGVCEDGKFFAAVTNIDPDTGSNVQLLTISRAGTVMKVTTVMFHDDQGIPMTSLGQPHLIVYRDLIWIFHMGPRRDGRSFAPIYCTLIRRDSATGEYPVLYKGPIYTMSSSGKTQQMFSKYSAVPAVYDDTLYLAFTDLSPSTSLGYLGLVRNRPVGAIPTSGDAFLFGSAINALAPPANSAIDSGLRPITISRSPSLCAYNGLLYLTYADYADSRKLYELTYDGHAFGVERLFDTEHETGCPLTTVSHEGALYTFYQSTTSGLIEASSSVPPRGHRTDEI